MERLGDKAKMVMVRGLMVKPYDHVGSGGLGEWLFPRRRRRLGGRSAGLRSNRRRRRRRRKKRLPPPAAP